MNKNFGCQSMVGEIKRVLVKHPKDAYQNQLKIDAQSKKLNYLSKPAYKKSTSDYEQLINFFKKNNIEIHYLPMDENTSLDSIYTHDPCVVTNSGVILSNMGKIDRQTETKAIASYFSSINVPILGQIRSPGKLEGGDVVWIDERTVAVGEGYRTNAEGISQFKSLLNSEVDNVITVPLPHWTGPADCLHLMSNVSPIDSDLYLVYSKLLPVSFREYLLGRGIKLIEVPDEEYNSMGCNVLAISPRNVIMINNNPITQQRLEAENVQVYTYDGSEISIKGSGGPTCLTRPFMRL
ncbi:arginine deiminase family protein [Candidatus Marinimicrobia bacterium]|nr:arginine deiminase family protein [Candidatus Neomarinimicrobiota bacterium]